MSTTTLQIGALPSELPSTDGPSATAPGTDTTSICTTLKAAVTTISLGEIMYNLWHWLPRIIAYGLLLGAYALLIFSMGTAVIAAFVVWRLERYLKSLNKNNYDWMLDNAGSLLHTITPDDIHEGTEPVTSEPSPEVLCTYAWKNTPLESREPTIYVPGFAPRWNSNVLESGPVEVKRDSGIHWVDQHVTRQPMYQFEPMFQAMSVMNPGIRFDDVDIVIGRTNMLGLLESEEVKGRDAFALELKLVHNTLFLSSTGGKGFAGCPNDSYGRNFEKLFTESTGEPDADGYHRVLKYKFGALKVVVRLEADAYHEQEIDVNPEQPDEVFRGHKLIDASSPHAEISYSDATAVIKSGTYIKQSMIVELKTTAKGPSEPIKKALPQLWFGRTSLVAVGQRKSYEREAPDKSGKVESYMAFHTANMQNAKRATSNGEKSSRISEWEQTQQASLKKLSGFLGRLRKIVSQVEGGKAVLRKTEKGGPIEVYAGKEDMQEALPKAIREVFWESKMDLERS